MTSQQPEGYSSEVMFDGRGCLFIVVMCVGSMVFAYHIGKSDGWGQGKREGLAESRRHVEEYRQLTATQKEEYEKAIKGYQKIIGELMRDVGIARDSNWAMEHELKRLGHPVPGPKNRHAIYPGHKDVHKEKK